MSRRSCILGLGGTNSSQGRAQMLLDMSNAEAMQNSLRAGGRRECC